ncbi:hypothetical protein B0F90DRAFT_1682241 [Multifurca ochricompacta]|uniref:Uncharacterized protein n=1 Tax=Multifurca ochricompacta TaxID=376703 RepID=A0AAD4MHU2_9AGAM|nr:hypothetical protein B0F90DRAFT_1682241 [Multifurca ochricompacta]
MGCIPSKRGVLDQFDGHGRTMPIGRTSKKTRTGMPLKPPKYRVPKPKKRGPASPVIPVDAPPWVTGHAVMSVHQDAKTGEVYLTEKCR